MSSGPLIIRNSSAVFGWAFMVVWMAMLAMFTWLFVREGGFHQFDRWIEIAILTVFWLGGIAGCSFFFSLPLTVLRTDGAGLAISERRIWTREHVRIARKNIARVEVLADTDSEGEGEVYYKLVLSDAAGRDFLLSESPHRPTVEAVHAKLGAHLAGRRR